MTKSSREKYNLIYLMVNELTEDEKCKLIIDLIEDVEISLDREMDTPIQIRNKASKVIFDN